MDFLKRMLGIGGDAPSDAGHEMISWVVLSDTCLDPTVESVRAALDGLYPGQFLPANDRNFVMEGPEPGSQF